MSASARTTRAERRRGAERARAVERLPVVLALLRTAPTHSLHGERRDLLRAGAAADPAIRRMLAEHYRALRSPDQAARWGIAIPGWTRASEVRALRRTLLERLPRLDAGQHLGLPLDVPVPSGIADVVVAPPAAGRFDWLGGVAVTLGCAGVLGVVVGGLGVAIGVVVRIATGTPGAETGEFLMQGVLFVVGAGIVGGGLLVAFDAHLKRQDARRRRVVAAHVAELWQRLTDADERHVLVRGWLSWAGDEEEETARRMLVELARERRRPAEAGRWGAPVDGLATAAERAAFARTLRAGDDWMRELELRVDRQRPTLSRDERDVLVRAGIAEAVIDAFIAERADGSAAAAKPARQG
ncbi:hypothetical protein [Agrococcus jejuensis]|uniref:hypothetical protein n=1 Tax=Agrococcus jejuensis TaxID=399736 RepID=UPI00119EFB69|nr:hypothetical protein [Agrococcus jejuensis]